MGMSVNEWLTIIPESPLDTTVLRRMIPVIGKVRQQDITPMMAELGESLNRVKNSQIFSLLAASVAVHRMARVMIASDQVQCRAGVLAHFLE